MAAKEADAGNVGYAPDESDSKTDGQKLENWMETLPEHLHDVPIHTLYIPGSHNSGTDQLRQDWEVGPDADQAIRTLSALPMAKAIIHSWSRCQNLSTLEQLRAGVRYLDLRVAHRAHTDELYLIHALYGPTVSASMEQVKSFLEEHEKEVVLLDFNHFYNMELEHHMQVITYLILTLNSMREKGTCVVVFYAHSTVVEFPNFWPPHSIKSMWSNTRNVDKCLSHQANAVWERCGDVFHVCQAVLIPSTGDIMQKMGSNLHAACAMKINHRVPQWMQQDGLKGCRGMVFIADFVEEGGFLHTVVGLNK
ncbi:hypothetical protein ACOMHN_000789 [Nucella lapillus]